MRIELREHRPPVSPGALDAAEARLVELGHPIPPSYRAFLAEQDGGKPVRDCFTFREGEREQKDLVRWFYGLAESPNGDLVRDVESLVERVPAGMLSIAEDGNGNALVLDGRDGRDGPLYFWDHELEVDPPDESNLSWVAPDLQSFLDELIEDPEPPPVPEPGRLQRLFGRR